MTSRNTSLESAVATGRADGVLTHGFPMPQEARMSRYVHTLTQEQGMKIMTGIWANLRHCNAHGTDLKLSRLLHISVREKRMRERYPPYVPVPVPEAQSMRAFSTHSFLLEITLVRTYATRLPARFARRRDFCIVLVADV